MTSNYGLVRPNSARNRLCPKLGFVQSWGDRFLEHLSPNADLGQLDPKTHAASKFATPQRDGEFEFFFIYSPPRTSNALSDLESAIMAVIRSPITDHVGQLDPNGPPMPFQTSRLCSRSATDTRVLSHIRRAQPPTNPRPKRWSISRNRRDEIRLRGCWFRGAA